MTKKFVDWEHIKQIIDKMAKEKKSAEDVYYSLVFAVEKVHAVNTYVQKKGSD